MDPVGRSVGALAPRQRMHVAPTSSTPEALTRRFGHAALSFHALGEGLQYFVEGDTCIAYADLGDAWVAVANPLASPELEPAAMAAFVEAASRAGRRARFFGVEGCAKTQPASLRYVKIGEQPIWNPQTWPRGLGKRLRGQLRRAKHNRVVTVRQVAPEELRRTGSRVRSDLDRVMASWLRSRGMAAMGFVVSLRPYHRLEERRFFVAEREGRVVGALVAVPIYARGGWFLDNMLREPGAPNGTIELLFDHVMKTLAADGCEYVTFGLCPLMNVPTPWLRWARDWGARFYRFEGLQRFKAKLEPNSWAPVYLVHPAADLPLLALLDAARAFLPHGVWRFLWDTACQRMPGVMRWPAIAQCLGGLGALATLGLHPTAAGWPWVLGVTGLSTWFGARLYWMRRDCSTAMARRHWHLGLATGLAWIAGAASAVLPALLALPSGTLALGLAGFLRATAARTGAEQTRAAAVARAPHR